MKIIPPGVSFEQALRSGMTGRIEHAEYLAWIRTMPCDTCGALPPSDASHPNGFKGMGTKSPDWWCIPECRACNRKYDLEPPAIEYRQSRAALYLLRAICENRLVWFRALNGDAVLPLLRGMKQAMEMSVAGKVKLGVPGALMVVDRCIDILEKVEP